MAHSAGKSAPLQEAVEGATLMREASEMEGLRGAARAVVMRRMLQRMVANILKVLFVVCGVVVDGRIVRVGCWCSNSTLAVLGKVVFEACAGEV